MTDPNELIGYRRRDKEEVMPDHNELIALLLNKRFIGKTDLQILESAAAALRHMTQEIAALRPDAQRYRWLRDKSSTERPVYLATDYRQVSLLPSDLDAVIDTAIVAEKRKYSVTDSIDSPQAPLT